MRYAEWYNRAKFDPENDSACVMRQPTGGMEHDSRHEWGLVGGMCHIDSGLGMWHVSLRYGACSVDANSHST